MKKLLAFVLVLIFALGAVAVAEDKVFDMSAIEKSRLYKKDRYNGTWSIYGEYNLGDAMSSLRFVFGTNSQMTEWEQPFMFQIYITADGQKRAATEITFFLDDTRYDFSNLQYLGDYAVVNSGSVLRDLLNNLKNSKEIAFRVNFDVNGSNAHIDIESSPEYFTDLIEIADVFEKANAWSIFDYDALVEGLDSSNNATKTLPEGATVKEITAKDEESNNEEKSTETVTGNKDEMTADEWLEVIHAAQRKLAEMNAGDENGKALLYDKGGLKIYIERLDFWKDSRSEHCYLDMYLRVINDTNSDYEIFADTAEINGWVVGTAGWINSNAHTKTKEDDLQFPRIDASADVFKLEDIETLKFKFRFDIGGKTVYTEPIELVMNPDTQTLFRVK